MAVITPVRVQPGFKGLVTLAELIGEPLEAHQKRIARTWLESEAGEVMTIAPKENHKTTTVALAGLPDVEFVLASRLTRLRRVRHAPSLDRR